MQVLRNITEVLPCIRPFPDPATVFSEPVDVHCRHLLPLVCIDASIAHPDLDVWLPVICPIEPLLELDIGCFTESYHDEYNIQGQIAFRRLDGKFRFYGNFNYFAYESRDIFNAFPGRDDEIEEDRQLRLQTFEAARDRYQQSGLLLPENVEPTSPSARQSCLSFVKQLGGESGSGNWASAPVNQSGQTFRFVATVMGALYSEGAAQFIDLYYDPDEEVSLMRFDWT